MIVGSVGIPASVPIRYHLGTLTPTKTRSLTHVLYLRGIRACSRHTYATCAKADG